ncbi:unnamed protein product [Alopecurus aequalis]
MVRKPMCKPFLVPLDKEEAAAAEDTAAFRVIWMARCKTKLSAFVFSSSTGQWRAAAPKAWTDLVVDKGDSDYMSQVPHIVLRRHYAYGCFYWDWLLTNRKKLLVLDTRRMEFSMADFPPGEWIMRGLAIVETGEGRVGMFGFHGTTLSYTVARNKGDDPSQWQTVKRISLDSGYKYYIKVATESCLLLRKTGENSPLENPLNEFFSMDIKTETSSLENPLTEYFSIDVKTFKFHRFCAQGTDMYWKHIYTNFPPSFLSSPTI